MKIGLIWNRNLNESDSLKVTWFHEIRFGHGDIAGYLPLLHLRCGIFTLHFISPLSHARFDTVVDGLLIRLEISYGTHQPSGEKYYWPYKSDRASNENWRRRGDGRLLQLIDIHPCTPAKGTAFRMDLTDICAYCLVERQDPVDMTHILIPLWPSTRNYHTPSTRHDVSHDLHKGGSLRHSRVYCTYTWNRFYVTKW